MNTNRKRTADSFADRESALFNTSTAAHADVEPETGRFLQVNAAFSRLSGYSEKELLSKYLQDLFSRNGKNALRSVFPWDKDGNLPGSGRLMKLFRKNGTELNVRLHISAYGEPVRAILVSITDQTAERMHERELKKAHEQIDVVHKLKNDFLSHVSHELRTPIGGIMGMTEVLMHKLPDEELKQFLTVIKESARSLLSIVEDILDLSNIETGRLELRAMEFDLQQELERTVGLFRDRAKEKRLKLSLRLSMEIPRLVFGDPRRLSQIIRNLIENAIEYTDAGEISVNVRKTGEEEGQTRLQFSIEDSGPGIPEADEQFLFTEFGRLKDVYTRSSHEGTGLGLAITKKLVQLMGGDIRYHRKDPSGGIFTFTVRMKTSRMSAPETGSGEHVRNSLSALPPLRILMVEDNLINRLFLGMMLKDSGHMLVEVENGILAVSAVKEAFETGNPFDLILMDVQMPEMNGMDATRIIRKMKGPAALVPIIAITAFAMKSDEEKFLEAGMDGYVTKPVDFEELADTIMRITDSDILDAET